MTEEQETILNIRVNYQEAVKGIREYTAKIDEANRAQDQFGEQLAAGEISAEEYADSMATAKNAVKVYEANIRTLNKEIQNNIKEQQAQDGSLVQLRAQLSNLTKAYDNLSQSERESGQKGEELRNKINEVTTQLKAAEESTQRYYRNVGNYENAIKNTLGMQSQWFTQLQSLATLLQGGVANAAKTVATAVQGVGKQFLALLANPIVAVIAAIAAVFITLQKALQSNEEGMRSLQRVMAPFQAVLNALINTIQNLAQVIVGWVEGMERVALGISHVLERLPLVGSAIKSVNDKIEENIDLVKQQQELTDAQRRNEVLSAEEALKVAKIRDLAAKASDPRVRAYALQKAIEIEGKAMEREREIARQRYALAVREAQQTKNSAEVNDKLAKARAEYYKAETDYLNGTRRMQSQIRSANEQIAREEAEAQKKQTEAAKKGAEERLKNALEAKKKELEAIRAAEDAFLPLIKDNYERQRAQIEAQYDRRIADLRRRLAEEKNLTEEAIREINNTISFLYQQRADALQELEKQASAERIKTAIDNEQKRLQLIIDIETEGSRKRYEAQMALLQQQQDAATQEIEQSTLKEAEKQERLMLIAQKYDQERAALRVEQNQAEMEAAAKAFEDEIAQAQDNEVLKSHLIMQQRWEALNALHQMEGESNEAFRKRELEAEKQYTDARKKFNEQQTKAEIAKLEVAKQVADGMSKIMEAFGEESKAAVVASKVLALAQIAISTGQAIAEGVAQAQSVPFPANIAAVATTIGTIMGNIATAISTVKSVKLADGGLVTGPGTGTSDSIPAQLSNGESVMTAEATSMFAPLLSAMNQIGGGVPIQPTTVYTSQSGEGMDTLQDAMKEAMSEVRPVVAVEEINRVQNRVNVIEDLATA